MYVGSAEFRAANDKPVQKHKISGTIDGIAFTPNNLLQGSVTVTNQCSDSTDAKIGGVYVGTLKMTFLSNIGIEPETWAGRVIVLNFSLLTDEEPETWETFSLGVFTVAAAERNLQGVTVTAYDNMTKFDKKITWEYLPSGTLYTILSDVCSKAGVTCGMTQAQCEALPNGTENLGMYPGNDCETLRDILFYLAELVAGFCTINRAGELIIKSFINQINIIGTTPELPADRRLTGASISDYTTHFTGVSWHNMKTETEDVSGSSGGGIIYDLGANPFLQYGTGQTIMNMADQIRQAIGYPLRPFSATIMSAPIWELGDKIKLTEGIAEDYNSVTIIHSVTFTAGKGTKIQCFGANPVIVASNTQNKAASSAGNSARLNSTGFKRYSNLEGITIGPAPEKVTEINFVAEKETDFDIWHEYLIETTLGSGSTAVELTATYYLDGDLLDRKPVETYEDAAKHILTLNYSEGVTDGTHTWEVYLQASGGTATIKPNEAIAVLKGEGLSKAEIWDGLIILSDSVQAVPFIMEQGTISESFTLSLFDPVMLQLAENVANHPITMAQAGITETVNLTLYQPAWPIGEEDSTDVLAIETGNFYIETE